MNNTGIEKIFDNTGIIKEAEEHFNKKIDKEKTSIEKTKKIALTVLSFSIFFIASSVISVSITVSVIVIGAILKAFTLSILSIFIVTAILTASLILLIIGIVILIISRRSLITSKDSLLNTSKKTLKFPFSVNKNKEIPLKDVTDLDFKKFYNIVQKLNHRKNLKEEDVETLNQFRNNLFNYDKESLTQGKTHYLGMLIFNQFYIFLKKSKNFSQVTPLLKILQCLEDIIFPKIIYDSGICLNDVNLRKDYENSVKNNIDPTSLVLDRLRFQELHNCYSFIFHKLKSKKYEIDDYNLLATKFLTSHSSITHLMNNSLEEELNLNSSFISITHPIESFDHLEKLLIEITKYPRIEENLKSKIKFEIVKIYLQKTLNNIALPKKDSSSATEMLFEKIAIPIWKILIASPKADLNYRIKLISKREDLLKDFVITKLKNYAKENFSIPDDQLNNTLKTEYLEPLKNIWPRKENTNYFNFNSLKNRLIKNLESS